MGFNPIYPELHTQIGEVAVLIVGVSGRLTTRPKRNPTDEDELEDDYGFGTIGEGGERFGAKKAFIAVCESLRSFVHFFNPFSHIVNHSETVIVLVRRF
jgi:hypothetical protein